MKKTAVSWDGAPIELSVKAVSKVGRLSRIIEDDATLRSGDLLSFVVSVSSPAFIYVVQLHPAKADGVAEREVLFPEHGSMWVEAGVETRIPEPGFWYELDQVTGVENIYFVASALPLEEIDRAIYEEVEEIRASSLTAAPPPPATAAPPPAPVSKPSTSRPAPAQNQEPKAASKGVRPAPVATTLATRGLKKTANPDDPTLRIQSDPDGIAILNFRVQHEGRQ